MVTRKLYYEDSYIEEFEAKVVSFKKYDDKFVFILDKSAFFPEGGGQSSDIGIIYFYYNNSNNRERENDKIEFQVLDVQLDKEGEILHYCILNNAEDEENLSLIKEGEKVKCKIDFIRRHSFMQHHTGEHMFSGLVNRDFGYSNVGFHLSDRICTMDYDGKLNEDDIIRLEKECNEWIYKNVAVNCFFPSEDSLECISYRCKGELEPPIRIVEIDGVDTCACCAPHVKSTGEVGLLFVADAKPYKGGMRLEILCGRKALFDYRKRSDLLGSISSMLSTHFDDVPARIASLKQDVYEVGQKYQNVQIRLMRMMACNLPKDDGNPILFVDGVDKKSMLNMANELMERKSGICGVFSKRDDGSFEFVLTSASIDLNEVSKKLRKNLNAKCGGNERMISGKVTASEEDIRREVWAMTK